MSQGKRLPSKRKGLPAQLADDQSLPVVAIVGRPNAGKSALFNRLVKRKDALVRPPPLPPSPPHTYTGRSLCQAQKSATPFHAIPPVLLGCAASEHSASGAPPSGVLVQNRVVRPPVALSVAHWASLCHVSQHLTHLAGAQHAGGARDA